MAGVQVARSGLSPRGRGKPLRPQCHPRRLRSIPAWAGETAPRTALAPLMSVYPRVGGGNWSWPTASRINRGLSPRGRGKLWGVASMCSLFRSIPAWAGETAWTCGHLCFVKVYPRVGGGNWRSSALIVSHRGLSPRGRGKPIAHVKRLNMSRSIPAWAGETTTTDTYAGLYPVYPRVGGGNVLETPVSVPPVGLSPRGRGKLPGWQTPHGTLRSIPAWAGETWALKFTNLTVTVYPRVGVGNKSAPVRSASVKGLSPRGRGKRGTGEVGYCTAGSIPAWAGETEPGMGHVGIGTVYPRVGGGNRSMTRPRSSPTGLSPRGRGKLAGSNQVAFGNWSIPAWAGETPADEAAQGPWTVYPRVGGGNSG